MKKNFTLAFFLGFSLISSAQLSKGKFLVGGTIGYWQDKSTGNEEGKYSIVSINPSIGKFYKNNRMFGINFLYAKEKGDQYPHMSKSTGASVFLRQYLLLSQSFYLLAEEGLNARISKQISKSPYSQHTEEKIKSGGIYFYPGLMYQVTKRMQLEITLPSLLSLNYSTKERKVFEPNETLVTKTKTFGLQTGTGYNWIGYLGFGVRFLLGK